MPQKLNHVLFSPVRDMGPVYKKVLAAAVLVTVVAILVVNWDAITNTPMGRYRAAYEGRRFDEAIQIAREILTENPDSIAAWQGVTTSYIQKALLRQDFEGSLAAAISAAQSALALDSGNSETRRLLGYALELSGKLSDAESQYRTALEKDPENPLLMAHLASLLRRFSKIEEARSYFLRAVLLSNGQAEVRVAAAQFFLAIDDPDGAIEVIGDAAEDDRPVVAAEANRVFSAALLSIGEIVKARPPAERALALAPESFSANQNYGDLLLAELFGPTPVPYKETLAEISDYASRALALNETSIEANFLAFKAAHIRGDRQEADAYAKRTLELLASDTSLSSQQKTSIRMFIRDLRNIEPRLINKSSSQR